MSLYTLKEVISSLHIGQRLAQRFSLEEGLTMKAAI